ncbi:alpha-galactosidase [Qipengyuania sp. 6B39]|uniref:alpha-galactosidase n=1 Tax=Qipengyuania proteolytica TaxID=2867239 RepID=UPI001C88FB0D|nr:alpha-galactosidase [Qipengyuania proteolytica]MBX7496975.1 alpha-galactosidase [Qipengyuania proteolytica]
MSDAELLDLHGEEWSLVLERGERAVPVWRHLGVRVDPGALPKLGELRGAATFSLEGDHAMDAFPVAGLGWFGPSILAVRGADGQALRVHFDGCDADSSEGSLRVVATDSVNDIECETRFRVVPGGGLEVSASLTNRSDRLIIVDRLASAMFPLGASSREIISWRGRHNAEFVECREPMPEHSWVRETRRGLTGHGGPCGAYVLSEDTGWHSGLAIAMQLAWSGDARLAIERDDEGFWIAMAETVIAPGEVTLAPGECYHAPPLLLAISTKGRNGAMAQMHGALRERIVWPRGGIRPRPVHLNSWEAVYFSHDEARIGELAEAAAAIGIERFILDDGWFRARDHDRAGLGDWEADPRKYPQGLKPLADKVRRLGMEFGLWVEPEMVNPDSDLYRAHPDWVLALEGRERPTARNQLVLDMRREDVRDYLFGKLDQLLSTVDIAYLKWDHNRDHAPSGGAAQTRGTYALLERLRTAHPKVEIESCAGGGGRIDAGIASYTHRFWTSDNIDAVARVPMQRGFLAFMPPEVMGAHVGASPSHATGRTQSLDFRAAIACQGHLGVELDPAAMEEGVRAKLADWLGFWKEWRHVIIGGRTVLGEAADGLVWQAQGTDDELLLWLIRSDHGADRRARPVLLPFAEDREWDVQFLRHAGQSGVLTPRAAPAIAAMREKPHRFSGDWLAHAGLPVPALAAESALIYHLRAVS